MEALKHSIDEVTVMFNAKMPEFQNELQNNSHSSSTASPTVKLTNYFNNFKTFVLNALKSLQSQISVLMELQDQNEMKGRKKILLIHGVSEEKKELLQTVSVLITSQLKLPDVDTSCIKYCHRLGRPNESRPRPILIKFHDIGIRNNIWKAKTNLKNSGITLSEFLTKRRHEIFLMARQRFGQDKCWTQAGTIIVIGPDGSRKRVCSMLDLDAIMTPTSEGELTVTTDSPTKKPPVTRPKKAVRINK